MVPRSLPSTVIWNIVHWSNKKFSAKYSKRKSTGKRSGCMSAYFDCWFEKCLWVLWYHGHMLYRYYERYYKGVDSKWSIPVWLRVYWKKFLNCGWQGFKEERPCTNAFSGWTVPTLPDTPLWSSEIQLSHPRQGKNCCQWISSHPPSTLRTNFGPPDCRAVNMIFQWYIFHEDEL